MKSCIVCEHNEMLHTADMNENDSSQTSLLSAQAASTSATRPPLMYIMYLMSCQQEHLL